MDHWSSKNLLAKRPLIHTGLALVLFFSLIYSYGWQRLAYNEMAVPMLGYELQINQGTSLTLISNNLAAQGILQHPKLLRWYAILTGQAHKIKAGEYMIYPGTTPLGLLEMLVGGLVTQHSFTIIEGWQTKEMLSSLLQHPKLKVTLAGLSEREILQKLAVPDLHLEGIFLPDTYFFVSGTTDVDFLLRAYNAMQDKLHVAWQNRDLSVPVKTPYEALILASIIEKESGLKTEYAEISGVYNRRLTKRMKLQADPTVIYAWQDQLQGPLRRKHLKIDSPYNTYMKYGLPPTPIALTSLAAIEAALHPLPGDTLYFVARGDGGHVFSSTLQAHNRAVHGG